MKGCCQGHFQRKLFAASACATDGHDVASLRDRHAATCQPLGSNHSSHGKNGNAHLSEPLVVVEWILVVEE